MFLLNGRKVWAGLVVFLGNKKGDVGRDLEPTSIGRIVGHTLPCSAFPTTSETHGDALRLHDDNTHKSSQLTTTRQPLSTLWTVSPAPHQQVLCPRWHARGNPLNPSSSY